MYIREYKDSNESCLDHVCLYVTVAASPTGLPILISMNSSLMLGHSFYGCLGDFVMYYF